MGVYVHLLKPPFLKAQSAHFGGKKKWELFVFTDTCCPRLTPYGSHLSNRDPSHRLTFRWLEAKGWVLPSYALRTNFPF